MNLNRPQIIGCAVGSILLILVLILIYRTSSSSSMFKQQHDGTYVSTADDGSEVYAIVQGSKFITYNPAIPNKKLTTHLQKTKNIFKHKKDKLAVYEILSIDEASQEEHTVGYLAFKNDSILPLLLQEKNNKFIQPENTPIFEKVSDAVSKSTYMKSKKAGRKRE